MPRNSDHLIETYRDQLADNAEQFLDVSRANGQPDDWTVSIMMSGLIGLAANLAAQTIDRAQFIRACGITFDTFVRSPNDTVN